MKARVEATRRANGTRALPRVLLCERNPLLARILTEVFAFEHIDVMECESLADIERALMQYPEAVVVTDSWTDSRHFELSVAEREGIHRLGERTAVVVTTARPWAYKTPKWEVPDGVQVISKPYDLDELIQLVRAGDASVRSH